MHTICIARRFLVKLKYPPEKKVFCFNELLWQVAEPCEVRRPNSLHISVMTSGWVAVNTTTVHHDPQSGSQVAIRITLPQNVDMCNLLVNIRVGNSAGTSLPTEIEVGRSCTSCIEF